MRTPSTDTIADGSANHRWRSALLLVQGGNTLSDVMPLVCLAIPLAALAAAYAWLALDHGTLALWDVVVHESGRYTFGQTIFYFEHFLREVPTAVAYVLFLMAASGTVGGGTRSAGLSGVAAVTAALGLAVAALFVSASTNGWNMVMVDLMQYRTRDDLVAYGSHWHFHWLSTLWFGFLMMLAPGLLQHTFGRDSLRRSRIWSRAAWGYFIALTIIFGFSLDIFSDARYIGHQAREILTHGPVTALLGLSILLLSNKRRGNRNSAASGTLWLFGGMVVIIPAYLIVAGLAGDVMEAGQTDQGLSAMVAAHYFEHTLDYVFIVSLLIGILRLKQSRSEDA